MLYVAERLNCAARFFGSAPVNCYEAQTVGTSHLFEMVYYFASILLDLIPIDSDNQNNYNIEKFTFFRKLRKMINFTAKYTKINSGYMGQLVEWPEVITEGKDLEECRAMLRDALNEMVLAYQQIGKEIPTGNALIEQLPIEVQHVGQAT